MAMNNEGNGSSTSLGVVSSNSGANTPLGESSNTIIGPNGILVPRSSILLNPSQRKTFVDQWRANDVDGQQPGPTVLRIAAVPTVRDREREREEERAAREREIEREVREKEQAEKVWGIPKKAFYLGLGEINFNAQMAMLGGWGTGSGNMTEVVGMPPSARRKSAPSLLVKKKRRGSTGTLTPTNKRESGNTKSVSTTRPASASGPQTAKGNSFGSTDDSSTNKEKRQDDGADSDTSMDLEELAALNAIINTRRSMEAAQALANDLSARSAPSMKRSASSHDASTTDPHHPRPSIPIDDRQPSLESVPTAASVSSDERAGSKPTHLRRYSDHPSFHTARIRFAPLPQIASHSVAAIDGMVGSNPSPKDENGFANGDLEADKSEMDNKRAPLDGSEEIDSDADEDFDGDESWSRRWSVSKASKWYLMGMPRSVFSPQSYRGLRRPSSSGGVEVAPSGELSSSPSQDRRVPNSAVGHASDAERRERLRSRGRRPTSSRASSIKSRSSSVGSLEDEDRERRRQLLRASRPGGTGMVTLPDGRKVRARRVGEEYSDEDDEDVSEWGFGRITRAAQRQTFDDMEPTTGDKRTSDDEGGRESDFGDTADEDDTSAKIKRRRRNRTGRDGDYLDAQQDDSAVGLREPNEFSELTDKRAPQEVQVSSSSKLIEAVGESGKIMPDGERSAGRMPTRSLTMPTGPITLSATQAAEVRRRHEEEVAALGAEVLHSLSKAKKTKQTQHDQNQQTPHSPPLQQSDGKGSHAAQNGSKSSNASPTSEMASPFISTDVVHADRGRTRTRPSRTYSLDDGKTSQDSGSKQASSPLRHPLRAKGRLQSGQGGSRSESARQSSLNLTLKSLVEQGRHVSDDAEGGEAQNTLPRTSTPPQLESDGYMDSSPQTPIRMASPETEDPAGEMTTSVSSLRTLRGRHQNDELSTYLSSPLSRNQSSELQASPDVSSSGTPADASVPVIIRSEDGSIVEASPRQSLSSSVRSASVYSMHRHRHHDLPSPWDLPRRPDARGYAVVPLPVEQLGRRPQRPREGRFWQSDDEEEVDESESEVGESENVAGHHEHGKTRADEDSDDEVESDMDAEQLAEEERRTAVQKKRATTRAAGAELVSGLAKHKSQAKLPTRFGNNRSTPVDRAPDRLHQFGRSHSSTSLSKSAGELPIAGDYSGAALVPKTSRSSHASSSHSAGSGRPDRDNRLRPVLSTSVLSTSRDRRGNSIARLHRRRDTWNDFDSDPKDDLFGAEDKREFADFSYPQFDDKDLSDVDDLWPPTLNNTLGGSLSPLPLHDLPSPITAHPAASRPAVTRRMPSNASNLSAGSSQASPSNVQLAMHVAKARAVREKREKETKERERERLRRLREMDESLDYGWPRSLQGSSLY